MVPAGLIGGADRNQTPEVNDVSMDGSDGYASSQQIQASLFELQVRLARSSLLTLLSLQRAF